MNSLIGNTSRLKELNVERLRVGLKSFGSATKRQLAQATQLSIASCGNILSGMLDTGEIRKGKLSDSAGGRPARIFEYNFRFHLMLLLHLGVEDGVRTITSIVADSVGNEIDRQSKIVPEITMDELGNAISAQLKPYPAIAAVSVSYPGVVNNGLTAHEVGDLPELHNCDIKGNLEQRFPIRVAVENDMNLAALGYFHGQRCPEDSSLCYVAFFILPGCGSIVAGELLRGSRGFSGEITWLPFGLTVEEYAKLQKTREGTISLTSKTILALTAILNPDTVVLCGKLLADANMREEIVRNCQQPQIRLFLPKIVFSDDWLSDIMAGLKERASELLRCPIQMIEK